MRAKMCARPGGIGAENHVYTGWARENEPLHFDVILKSGFSWAMTDDSSTGATMNLTLTQCMKNLKQNKTEHKHKQSCIQPIQ